MKSKTVNVYVRHFSSNCPVNNEAIWYKLKIRTEQTIMVEDILKKCTSFKEGFHEDIAKELHKTFGGKQTITACHHGVKIKTIRK